MPEQRKQLMRNISIEPALNGYIVQVGCQTVVFNERKIMLSELARYFDDPGTIEREYAEKSPHGIGLLNQSAVCGVLGRDAAIANHPVTPQPIPDGGSATGIGRG